MDRSIDGLPRLSLAASWARLGPFRSLLGLSWGPLGDPLGASWAPLRGLPGLLGPSSGASWASWAFLGLFRCPLGPSWAHLGALLGSILALLGSLLGVIFACFLGPRFRNRFTKDWGSFWSRFGAK